MKNNFVILPVHSLNHFIFADKKEIKCKYPLSEEMYVYDYFQIKNLFLFCVLKKDIYNSLRENILISPIILSYFISRKKSFMYFEDNYLYFFEKGKNISLKKIDRTDYKNINLKEKYNIKIIFYNKTISKNIFCDSEKLSFVDLNKIRKKTLLLKSAILSPVINKSKRFCFVFFLINLLLSLILTLLIKKSHIEKLELIKVIKEKEELINLSCSVNTKDYYSEKSLAKLFSTIFLLKQDFELVNFTINENNFELNLKLKNPLELYFTLKNNSIFKELNISDCYVLKDDLYNLSLTGVMNYE